MSADRLNPVICIGWETIQKLAAGEDVYLESQNVRLLAASDLFGCDTEAMRHGDGREAGPSQKLLEVCLAEASQALTADAVKRQADRIVRAFTTPPDTRHERGDTTDGAA